MILVAIVLIGIALGLIVGAFIKIAHAHPWMLQGTSYCCNENDCAPIPRESVRRVPAGWYLPLLDFTFQDGSEHIHPNIHDNEFWLCMPKGGPPRCLFVPGKGA